MVLDRMAQAQGAMGRRRVMIGFADGSIALVYWLCIGSALLCAGYGLFNWHRGLESEPVQVLEEADWESGDPESEDPENETEES
jgi:hypothetical protein